MSPRTPQTQLIIEQSIERLRQYAVFGGLGLFALMAALTAALLTCVRREVKQETQPGR